MLSKEQIRGARAMLGWSQKHLGDVCDGVSMPTIKLIESGRVSSSPETLAAIRRTFEDAGLEFIGLEGVKFRKADVKTYTGRKGFLDFYDDIYEVAAVHGGEFLVSNVDEAVFMKWAGDSTLELLNRMSSLGKVNYKILVKEGDYNFVAKDYAEYRWLNRDYFGMVSFYVYGEKLAIMLLQGDPLIIVIDYHAVSEAYRKQFYAMWEVAKVPEKQQRQ